MKKISPLFLIVVSGVFCFYLSVFAQNPDPLIIPTTSLLLLTDRPNDGDPCDDQNPCTTDDRFLGGVCVGNSCSTPLSCEVAACTPTGCELTLKDGFCRINNECYGNGVVKIDNACKVCDASASPESWTDKSGLCNDGNACTMADTCTSGVCAGTSYICDDGLSCTDDSCDGDGTCTNSLQQGSCIIAGTCNAGNDCL